MKDMDTVRICEVSQELKILPQRVYGLLWSGKLTGKQDPETGAWTVRREDLEEFKRRRVEEQRSRRAINAAIQENANEITA